KLVAGVSHTQCKGEPTCHAIVCTGPSANPTPTNLLFHRVLNVGVDRRNTRCAQPSRPRSIAAALHDRSAELLHARSSMPKRAPPSARLYTWTPAALQPDPIRPDTRTEHDHASSFSLVS